MLDSDSASELSEQKSESYDNGDDVKVFRIAGEGTNLESLKAGRCFSTTVKIKE